MGKGKETYKIKGVFNLTIADLKEVVNEVLKQNPDVTIEIEKTPVKNSNSLYVRIYKGKSTTSLRISDHECRGSTRQIIINDMTSKSNICYKLQSAINDLHFKYIQEITRGFNG